jgi:hypothetical protein
LPTTSPARSAPASTSRSKPDSPRSCPKRSAARTRNGDNDEGIRGRALRRRRHRARR